MENHLVSERWRTQRDMVDCHAYTARMSTISLEDASLLIAKLKSESVPVLASFVSIAGGLECKIYGTVTKDAGGRMVVSSTPKDYSSELVFQIDGNCTFDYQETKDYPEQLKKPPAALEEIAKEFGDNTIVRNWPGYTSGINIFIPGKGRIALLELRGPAASAAGAPEPDAP